MRRCGVGIGLVVSVAWSCTYGEVETYRVGFSSSFPTINPVTVGVPQFDTRGGSRTLRGVRVEFVYNPSFRMTMENNSGETQTTGGQFDLLMAGVAPGGINLTSFLLSGSIPTRVLAPSDGVLNSGADYVDFGRLGVMGSRGFEASTLSSYIGSGVVNTRVTFLGLNVTIPPIPPINPFRVTTLDGRFEGEVAVTYTFVPAPGVVGVVGVAAAGLGVMSRRRRARAYARG